MKDADDCNLILDVGTLLSTISLSQWTAPNQGGIKINGDALWCSSNMKMERLSKMKMLSLMLLPFRSRK
ncbi:hypothetical protein Golax_008408, partial [Gossypium laxum]|nr:hypothetical protein [Gossypium laxum]